MPNVTLPGNAALAGGTKAIQCDFQDSDRQWLDGDGHLRKRVTNPDSQHRHSDTGQCGNGNKVTGTDAGRDSGAGTTTGQTGTPTTQTAGTAFNVTVNAVDANFNVVSNTDTVSITSSDTYATLPANAALAGGTKQFSVTFKTATGSGWTVTATYVSG